MSVPSIKRKTNGTAWKDSGWQILVAPAFHDVIFNHKVTILKSDFGPVWSKMVSFPCEVVVLCMLFEPKASCLALLTKVSECGSGWAGSSCPMSNRPPYKEGWLKKHPFFRETWAEYMSSPPGLTKTTSADVSPDTLGQLEMSRVKQQTAIQCSLHHRNKRVSVPSSAVVGLVLTWSTHYFKKEYERRKSWID